MFKQQYTSVVENRSCGNFDSSRKYPKKLFGPMFISWSNCPLRTVVLYAQSESYVYRESSAEANCHWPSGKALPTRVLARISKMHVQNSNSKISARPDLAISTSNHYNNFI